MKKENGITLLSLVIYVIALMLILGVMSAIINKFYSNTDAIENETEEILEFNKFNTYFLEEVKLQGNKVDTITNNYILFTSGSSFSFSNNKIYYNNKEICKDVVSISFEVGETIEESKKDETIVKVTLSFENFNKTINYKLEEIY